MFKSFGAQSRALKLPAVVASFWIIKILTTGMGEAASDYLVRNLGPFVAVGLGAMVFAGALIAQFRIKSYSRWIYWLAVAMVSVFGTMAADVVHIALGVPYLASTIAFSLGLLVTFLVWWRVEGTIAISSINTNRRETFYWFTVLCAFALGTATGDMTARTLNLGYLNSGFLFAIAFAVPLGAYLLKLRGATIWFWIAYVITRPFGASFADWVGADSAKGGLGFGFGNISLVLTALIIVLVALSHGEKPAAADS